MANRSPRRLIVDACFALAILACGVAAATQGPLRVPDGVCAARAKTPRYEALLGDGRLDIAVVLAEMDRPAHRALSREHVVRSLVERGFVQHGDRFERDAIAVDITLVPDARDAIGAALTGALAAHDVVYYNGHSWRGELAIAPPDGDYRIVMLDSCWTSQLYSERLLAPNRDVIGNRERTITGSIESLPILLDALVARASWDAILGELRERAEHRADARLLRSIWRDAEDYRLDAACRDR